MEERDDEDDENGDDGEEEDEEEKVEVGGEASRRAAAARLKEMPIRWCRRWRAAENAAAPTRSIVVFASGGAGGEVSEEEAKVVKGGVERKRGRAFTKKSFFSRSGSATFPSLLPSLSLSLASSSFPPAPLFPRQRPLL